MGSFHNRSADVSRFSMVPRADIPRSVFSAQFTHKTTFDAGYLIPVYVDEVLPGDSFKVRMTAFTRLATPIFPIMDNLHLDSFFFYVPLRLVWSNFERFMGEQANPSDSTSFLIPLTSSPAGGYPVGSVFDYFGLPTAGQVDASYGVANSALFLRAYNLIWNEWFRDQNLQNSVSVPLNDGPDAESTYRLLRRGKRHDYFTSCLPWPQKGSAVALPLSGNAPVTGIGAGTAGGTLGPLNVFETDSGAGVSYAEYKSFGVGTASGSGPDSIFLRIEPVTGDPMIYANLSQATATTINQLRQSFQIQKLLERDARGGTRYVELVRSHFGVMSLDARQQRPEYLGGGSTPITVNPIAQTSASVTGQNPLGTLAGMGTGVADQHGFSQSFTEHGIIIGLASVRADLTYQQGMHRMWSRRTRYDFYWPAFAHLGEQAVLSREIYANGIPAEDDLVFGYQERWSEYRHKPSRISGYFRSTAALTLDAWHLAQRFNSRPTLSSAFIEDVPPVGRITAIDDSSLVAQQFLFDSFFDVRMVRPIPAFSVPGLIDHF